MYPTIPARVDELLGYRAAISQAVEQARQEKIIGNSLEAEITLNIADDAQRAELEALDGDLDEFFILSDLKLAGAEPDGGSRVVLRPTKLARCGRCWRHRPTVGQLAAHPDLWRPLRGRGGTRCSRQLGAYPKTLLRAPAGAAELSPGREPRGKRIPPAEPRQGRQNSARGVSPGERESLRQSPGRGVRKDARVVRIDTRPTAKPSGAGGEAAGRSGHRQRDASITSGKT